MTLQLCDISNTLRQFIDTSNFVNNNLGLNPYITSIVYITKQNVDVFGDNVGEVSTRTEFPFLVGPKLDGYVFLQQVKSNDIFLSGGILTDKDYKLGPVVFPYTPCGTANSAGTDIILTNPLLVDNQNTQLFFHIVGPDFPLGAYFKRIWDQADNNVCYTIYIRNTGKKVI